MAPAIPKQLATHWLLASQCASRCASTSSAQPKTKVLPSEGNAAQSSERISTDVNAPKRPRFFLFDKPHFMLRPMEPTRRMGTWFTLQLYRSLREPQFTHEAFCKAAGGFSVFIANALADRQMTKLRYLVEKDCQKRLKSRLSTISDFELSLLRVNDADIMHDMLAHAYWVPENVKNIASRRILHVNYVAYMWRGGAADFESITGMPFASAQKLVGGRRLSTNFWGRVLVANMHCCILTFNQEWSKSELKTINQVFEAGLGAFPNSVTNPIQVETCRPFGDPNKPRAWSKYASDSSAYQNEKGIKAPEDVKSEKSNHKEKKNSGTLPTASTKKSDKVEPDQNLNEFLEVHGVKKPKHNPESAQIDEKCVDADNETIEKNLTEQLMIGIDDPCTVLIHDLPQKVKKTSIKEFLAPIRPKIIRVSRDAKTASALVTFLKNADKRRALQRTDSFFGGFKVRVVKAKVEKVEKKSEKCDFGEATEEVARKEAESETSQILDTGRLFVRNLSYTVTENDLRVLFEPTGPLSDVRLIVDKAGKSKGIAMVTFVFPEHAVDAYTKLGGTVYRGRMLHIIPGQEERKSTTSDGQSQENSSFKQKKAASQKAGATRAHNWNTLFLGASAVADVIAKKLDVDKSQVLDATSASSLGVRMALGETRIVRETRDFLLQNGVQLEAFQQATNVARSSNVILVKNLPAGTDLNELSRLFERFGELGRFLLPPEGITAIVEFLVDQHAKTAFKALAYSRFKNTALFLEWAPANVFSPDAIARNQKLLQTEQAEVEKTDTEAQSSELMGDDDGTSPTTSKSKPETPEKSDTEIEHEPNATLFVKNLSFETDDKALAEKFTTIGPLVSASVSKRRDKNRKELLSMGYGFVQFSKAKDAQKALKELQGALFQGHCLELKLSNRETHNNKETLSKSKLAPGQDTQQGDCTKILVRNVPFQCSESELRELFQAFGELNFVRLPKKLSRKTGGSHRGFAFVEFTNKKDAKRAFEALSLSTHLYGRRLVLEWSQGDASLLELRQRTRKYYAAAQMAETQSSGAGAGGKKIKLIEEVQRHMGEGDE